MNTTKRLNWHRVKGLGWSATSTSRWTVRGPIFGAPMFWLYRDGSRFTPTGHYDDAVHFTTAREAMRFAENLDCSTNRSGDRHHDHRHPLPDLH